MENTWYDILGVGEMDQLVKCLLCKYKTLSPIPSPMQRDKGGRQRSVVLRRQIQADSWSLLASSLA